MAAIHAGPPPESGFHRVAKSVLQVAALLTGVGAIFLFVLLGSILRQEATPKPSEVVAGCKNSESSFAQQSIHQTFRVEMEQLKPAYDERTSELQVWSEGGGERFASRWRDGDGKLQYALWHAATDGAYEYDPIKAPQALRRSREDANGITLVELSSDGVDLENLESGFLKWLERRRWQPVSLASDFSRFVDKEGATVEAERTTMSGRPVFRLRARRAMDRLVATMTLEVDAHSYQPLALKARLETPERGAELRLVVESVNVRPVACFSAAVFTPDVPVFETGKKADRSLDALSAKSQNSLRSEGDLVSEEIKIQYALHRVRACLGEAIWVQRDSGQNLIVEGVVETPGRKAQLLAALAPFLGSSWLRTNIEAVEEADAAQGASTQIPTEAEADRNAAALFRAREARAIELRGGRSPIQEQLERYFAQLQGEASEGGQEDKLTSVRRATVELSNKSVDLSNAALQEAWALRRLAEAYPRAKAKGLSPEAQWLLEAMVRDHLAELMTQIKQFHSLLVPVLSSALPAKTDSVTGPQMDVESPPASADSSWPAEALRLFRTVNHMDQITGYLFGGSSLFANPDEATEELLDDFSRVDGEFQQTEAQALRDFSDISDAPAAERVGKRL